MKKIIAISSMALIISACIDRDNPLDSKGDSYVKPSFAISGMPADRVILSNTVSISCAGNHRSSLYRFTLGDSLWSEWQSGSFVNPLLPDGLYSLRIESLYPGGFDTTRQTVRFSSLSTDRSFYFSPASISVANPIVNLAVYNLPDSVASIHCVLTKGTVDTAYTADSLSFVKTLYYKNVVDLSVLPGGKIVSGSGSVVVIRLAGVASSDTVGFSVVCQTKNGTIVPTAGTLGTVVE